MAIFEEANVLFCFFVVVIVNVNVIVIVSVVILIENDVVGILNETVNVDGGPFCVVDEERRIL